jgi:hypothetical protein
MRDRRTAATSPAPPPPPAPPRDPGLEQSPASFDPRLVRLGFNRGSLPLRRRAAPVGVAFWGVVFTGRHQLSGFHVDALTSARFSPVVSTLRAIRRLMSPAPFRLVAQTDGRSARTLTRCTGIYKIGRESGPDLAQRRLQARSDPRSLGPRVSHSAPPRVPPLGPFERRPGWSTQPRRIVHSRRSRLRGGRLDSRTWGSRQVPRLMRQAQDLRRSPTHPARQPSA